MIRSSISCLRFSTVWISLDTIRPTGCRSSWRSPRRRPGIDADLNQGSLALQARELWLVGLRRLAVFDAGSALRRIHRRSLRASVMRLPADRASRACAATDLLPCPALLQRLQLRFRRGFVALPSRASVGGMISPGRALALEDVDFGNVQARSRRRQSSIAGGMALWLMPTRAQAVSSTLIALSGNCRPEM